LVENIQSGDELSGFDNNNIYDFYIVTTYNGETSDWSDLLQVSTFEPPSDFQVNNIQVDSVELNWTEINGLEYNIKYNILGSDTFTQITKIPVGFKLTELVDNTDYEIYIQSEFLGFKSSWSEPLTFKTLEYDRSNSADITVKFNIKGILYEDIKNSDVDTQKLIIKNALASIYNINAYGIVINSIEFNSIDVNFQAEGVFSASNFDIDMSDETNIVNSFVNSANNSGLATYTENDLTLNGVDSRGDVVNSDGVMISFTCFCAGSLVQTDQGEIEIEKLSKNINTINGLKIKAITKTIYGEDKLVLLKKECFNVSQPSKDLIVSGKHRLFLNEGAIQAKDLVNKYEGVEFIKNDGRVLYNVLLEENIGIIVNNVKAESLDGNNVLAKLYTKYTKEERNKIIIELNKMRKEGLYRQFYNYCNKL